MTTSSTAGAGPYPDERDRAANPLGAIIAIIGIIGFCISVFLDWLGVDNGQAQGGSRALSGYDLNTVIPLLGLLGLGLAIALLYAQGRASRRQHRGLTLVTMAVGLAATGIAIAYLVSPPGLGGNAENATTKIGVFVALASGALWALGSGIFANEPQGDEHAYTSVTTRTVPSTGASGADTASDGTTAGNVRPTTTPTGR